MQRLERQTIRKARHLGFDVIGVSATGKGHKILKLSFKGKSCSISLPSSPKNFDDAGKLAVRNLKKLKRSLK